jgi:hypothetical protein
LNIRSSIDTSSTANVLAVAPAGTLLALLESDGGAKVGAVNQWWYLESVAVAEPAPVPEPTPGPISEPPVSTPEVPDATPEPPEEEKKDDKLIVVVSSAVGTSGLRLRKSPSMGGALVTVLKAGTRLTVLDPAKKAQARIGKANQWLHVRTSNNQRGYVSAQYVSLP